MGGNALKSVTTRRYNAAEYYTLMDELVPIIRELFDTVAMPIQAVRSKESFGDADILVLGNKPDKEILESKLISIGATEMYHNANVTSFDYKELQIDLIFTSEENWTTSAVFFSYNDMGNLMGKLAHKFGLKYGHQGLTFQYRVDNDKTIGEFVVSKDPQKIFHFFGLSWNRYCEGFETIEDVFNFVITSPYFTKSTFYMENLNHIDRKRNRKRPNYNKFISFVNRTDEYSHLAPIADNTVEWNKDKTTYYDMIDAAFPECHFYRNLHHFRLNEDRIKLVRSKFNGQLVMEKYENLKGNQLGAILNAFKLYISNKYQMEFSDAVYASSDMMSEFDDWYAIINLPQL